MDHFQVDDGHYLPVAVDSFDENSVSCCLVDKSFGPGHFSYYLK